MKYMMLIYMNENALSPSEMEQCYGDSTELTKVLHEQGKFLGASPLQKTSTATSVRVREGKALVTSGPFAETHEQLGGFFLVDAQSQEEAVDIAIQIPGAKVGTVEIRPVVELPGLPDPGVQD